MYRKISIENDESFVIFSDSITKATKVDSISQAM